MSVPILSWSSKKIKRLVRSSLALETSSVATFMKQLDLMRKTQWRHMTTAHFSLDNYEGDRISRLSTISSLGGGWPSTPRVTNKCEKRESRFTLRYQPRMRLSKFHKIECEAVNVQHSQTNKPFRQKLQMSMFK